MTASKPCPLVFRPDDLQVSALSHGRRASVGVRGADEGLACTDDALDVHTLAGQDRHAQPGLGVVALGGGEVTPGELGVGEPAELERDGAHDRRRVSRLGARKYQLAHGPGTAQEGSTAGQLEAAAEQRSPADDVVFMFHDFGHGDEANPRRVSPTFPACEWGIIDLGSGPELRRCWPAQGTHTRDTLGADGGAATDANAC